MTSTQSPGVAGQEPEDAELMREIALGSSQALEVLYQRYSRLILSFASRMLGDRQSGEELVQEVYIRAWKQAGNYAADRGSVVTWLLSITHNLSIDEIRKRNRRPLKADATDPVLLLTNLSSNDPDAHELAELADLRQVMTKAINSLPEKQRVAIELSYYNGLTQREVAEHLGEPLGTIKTRMRLGMLKLRETLESSAVSRP